MAQQTLTPGLLQQLDALTTGFKQHANLGQLSPDLLSYLASMQPDTTDWGLTHGFNTSDGRSIRQNGYWANTQGGNPDSQALSFDPSRVNLGGQPIDFMLNTDESNLAAVFNPDGTFRGYEQRMDNNNWRDFITSLLMMAPAVAGVYGAAGAAGGEGGAAAGVGGSSGMGGGAGGLGATEGLTSGMNWADWAAAEQSGALAGSGYVGADFLAGEAAAAAAAGGGQSALQSAAQKAAASEAARQALQQNGSDNGDMRAQERGGYQSDPNAITKAATTNGNMMSEWDKFVNGVQQWLGNGAGNDPNSWANLASKYLGNNAGGLLGGLAGYLDGKDKQITSQTAPWSEAQPYLKGLLGAGATLWDHYQQQPFSPAEQAAFHNLGGVLDVANLNAGGLMDGFQATASGQNQFSRSNPRRSLIGSSFAPTAQQWQPQLYGDFGAGSGGRVGR
jgi:hypothetical protein